MNTVVDTTTPDGLLLGLFPVVTDVGTLITGQNLTRGAVLGKITASGKLTRLDKSEDDGSQVPYAILADDVDATSADKTAPLYIAGSFDAAKLNFVSGTAAADVKDAARNVGLYFVTVSAAV